MSEYIFKVVIVGPHGAGKTSLVRRLCGQADSCAQLPPTPTIGTDFHSCVVEDVEPQACSVRLQLWDTAGLEKYAASPETVYANANACIAVADSTRPGSLSEVLTKWLPGITAIAPELARECILIVCNKADELPDGEPSAADRRETRSAVDAAGYPWSMLIDGSATTGKNIQDAIRGLCKQLLETTDLGTEDEVSAAGSSPSEAVIKHNPYSVMSCESIIVTPAPDDFATPTAATPPEIRNTSDIHLEIEGQVVESVQQSDATSSSESVHKASESYSPPGSPGKKPLTPPRCAPKSKEHIPVNSAKKSEGEAPLPMPHPKRLPNRRRPKQSDSDVKSKNPRCRCC